MKLSCITRSASGLLLFLLQSVVCWEVEPTASPGQECIGQKGTLGKARVCLIGVNLKCHRLDNTKTLKRANTASEKNIYDKCHAEMINTSNKENCFDSRKISSLVWPLSGQRRWETVCRRKWAAGKERIKVSLSRGTKDRFNTTKWCFCLGCRQHFCGAFCFCLF